jgi:hypothetical protein
MTFCNNRGRDDLWGDTLPREGNAAKYNAPFHFNKEVGEKKEGGLNERCSEDYCECLFGFVDFYLISNGRRNREKRY